MAAGSQTDSPTDTTIKTLRVYLHIHPRSLRNTCIWFLLQDIYSIEGFYHKLHSWKFIATLYILKIILHYSSNYARILGPFLSWMGINGSWVSNRCPTQLYKPTHLFFSRTEFHNFTILLCIWTPFMSKTQCVLAVSFPVYSAAQHSIQVVVSQNFSLRRYSIIYTKHFIFYYSSTHT